MVPLTFFFFAHNKLAPWGLFHFYVNLHIFLFIFVKSDIEVFIVAALTLWITLGTMVILRVFSNGWPRDHSLMRNKVKLRR